MAEIRKRDLRTFMKNQVTRLIVPYFVWGFISIVIYYTMGQLKLLESDTRFFPNLVGLILADSTSDYFQWNRPLWFIPCLFVLNVFWFLICKGVSLFWKKDRWLRASLLGISMIIFGLGFLQFSFGKVPSLPWHIQSAWFICPLMGLGILLKGPLQKMGARPVFAKIFAALISTALALAAGASTIFTDFRQGIFGGYLRFYFVSFCLSVAAILLGQIIGHNILLQYIGKRTLPILLMHKFPVLFFQQICPVVRDLLNQGNVLAEIMCSLGSILLCLLVTRLMERYMPGMIGGTIK